jgi:hypothetical protein
MSEPTKENPKTSKRSRRKPAMEPLGWDEIVSQPGMGGYLSFLNGPVPLPHLGRAPAVETTPGPVSGPVVVTPGDLAAPDTNPGAGSTPGVESISASTSAKGAETTPGIEPVATPLSPSLAGLAATPGVGQPARPFGTLSSPKVEPTPGTAGTPGLASISGSDSIEGVETTPVIESSTTHSTAPTTGLATAPGVDRSLAPSPARPLGALSGPELETTPGSDNRPHRSHSNPTPEVISIPAVPPGPRLRIRKCIAAQDGHSLGEEVLYQALWKTATPESDETRTIVIGWRGMSQICRMTPKNCKINTQRLIRKLALEVLSPYNTPESIGTTYRVYASDAILRRRRSAGLEWVVRSRGVEFVDPTTGQMHSAHLCGYVSE